MDAEFFNKRIHLGFHSSNCKRSAEVAQESVSPRCYREEEVGFVDAGVNCRVEVKTDELRAGRKYRKGVCVEY